MALRTRAIAVFLLIAVLALAGGYEVTQRPASIFPAVTFPVVKVIADVGSEPAARMMPTVTRPLEAAILRVPGIVTVRSTTSRGSSEVDAIFAWGTDMEVALARVHFEAQRVLPDLPPGTRLDIRSGTRLDIRSMNTATYPIEGYALTSSTRTQAELRDLAEYTLSPALVRVPGVSQVQIQGGRRREFEIRLDPAALEGRHLATKDVVDAIKADDQVLPAGLTARNHELYLALVDGRAESVEALTRLAIPVPGGTPATLGELGTVATADELSYVRTIANGKEAVLVNVVRQPGANTVSVASGIEQLLHDHPELLPSDVTWSSFYDQAKFVSDSVSGVRDAILIGVGLAAVVLLVFLRSLRLTLIAVLAIPLAVAIVGLGLTALGQTINLMTLAGIAAALGLIADDAIVVIENINRRREAGDDEPAATGIREIRSALIGSSLSTTVVFLPFALLHGVVGAFFKPLALTMALVLVVSFMLAWIAVPVSVAVFGTKKERDDQPEPGRLRRALRRLVARVRENRVLRAVEHASGRAYGWSVDVMLRRGWIAAACVTALLGGAYFLYHSMSTDFLPAMDEGSIILDYWTPPGTSLEDTNAMLTHVDRVIGATPDVRSYSRRTGTQLGFFLTEPNHGDYAIALRPRGSRRPIEEVISEQRARISSLEPAIHIDFGQLLEDNIGDLSGGTPQPIDVKIFGADQPKLESTAQRAAKIVAGVPGVIDVFDGVVVAGPALDVQIAPEAAARYGLTTADVHAAVEPAVVGTVVGNVRVGERMYDLRVLTTTTRSLLDLGIRTPSGALVHLGDVATVETGAPETEIDRENLRTYVGVTGRLSGRSLGGAMADVRARLGRELPMPGGMSLEYGGTYAQQQSSFRELLYVLFGGLVLVAIVVLFELGDWRAPLLVSVVALSSLAGVFVALLVTGMTMNISSFVGAIMMVGIVGENSIFVIHEAKLALSSGTPVREAWSRASHRRLRPVAMTILATALALLPLALALGQGSQLMQPLAIAIIGGFLLAGPLVLFALPALYAWLDPHGALGGDRLEVATSRR